MLRIGALTLQTPMLLAPMAGHCDLAFRILCREQGGVGLASTDLLNSHALLRGARRSLELAQTNEFDQPCGMQLYGNWTDPLPEAAIWAVDHGAKLIDINMGCPVDKVAKKHGGSLLLCHVCDTVQLAKRIVDAVAKHTNGRVPVTAKVRLGWDPDRFVAPDLARQLEDVGIAAVTVHGRYTCQMFSGHADWNRIGEVVAAVKNIPIIGNGDVTEPEHAVQIMKQTGCKGVMVGRGSLRTPWLFQRASHLIATGELLPEPTPDQKCQVIDRHIQLLEQYSPGSSAVECMRKRISWYGKNMGHVKPLKEGIRTSNTTTQMRQVIADWRARSLESIPIQPISAVPTQSFFS